MEEVLCPPSLKQKLQKIWEGGNSNNEVIRSVILSNVFEDEDGNVESELDETLYHTFYRFLFFFGIPKEKNNWTDGCRVWKAITSCLQSKANKRPKRKVNQAKAGSVPGHEQYENDRKRFSIQHEDHKAIARARRIYGSSLSQTSDQLVRSKRKSLGACWIY